MYGYVTYAHTLFGVSDFQGVRVPHDLPELQRAILSAVLGLGAPSTLAFGSVIWELEI